MNCLHDDPVEIQAGKAEWCHNCGAIRKIIKVLWATLAGEWIAPTGEKCVHK